MKIYDAREGGGFFVAPAAAALRGLRRVPRARHPGGAAAPIGTYKGTGGPARPAEAVHERASSEARQVREEEAQAQEAQATSTRAAEHGGGSR